MVTLRADLGDKFSEPNVVLRVDTSASRLGSESDNLKLTQQRAEVLEKLLRQEGFTGRIELNAHGEAAPPDEPTPMALDAPVRKGPETSLDDPADRVATVEVVHFAPTVSFEGEGDTVIAGEKGKRDQLRELDQAVRSGEPIYKARILDRIGEETRRRFPVEDNPFGPGPSKDPKEFGKQVIEHGKDAVKAAKSAKDAAELAGKLIGGTLFEGAVRETWKHEIAMKRGPVFTAAAEGVAAALDSLHERKTYSDPLRQQAWDSAFAALADLSEVEKEQVTKYLVETARNKRTDQFDVKPDAEWVGSHSEGGDIRFAAILLFEQDYYQRD